VTTALRSIPLIPSRVAMVDTKLDMR
jgi:hypothetical protein